MFLSVSMFLIYFGFQEAVYGVDSVETALSDWIEHTSRNGKKYVITFFSCF